MLGLRSAAIKITISLLLAFSLDTSFNGSLNLAIADENTGTEQITAEAEEQDADETHPIPDTGDEKPSEAALEHYRLGDYYFKKFDLPLAEMEMDEAILKTPNFKAAHRALCFVSFCRFNIARSLAEFMLVTGITVPVPYTDAEIAELNKKASDMHYKKSLAWAKKSNWRETVTELEWARIYTPKNFQVQHSLAFTYANMGDYDKAEKQYESTFALAPNDGTAHADYAYLLSEHGNDAKAQKQMSEAVRTEPNVPALHVDLGWMAEHRGDLKTAEAEFQKAVEISPKYSGLWLHLGRILEQEGQVDQAKSAYNKALSINPDQLQAKEGLERLSKQKSS